MYDIYLQAAYVTSTFPYLILMILLVRGLTLEGSREGVLYYITPQWHRLASAEVCLSYIQGLPQREKQEWN